MKFTFTIAISDNDTLDDVIMALRECREGLMDGGEPLEVGDSGMVRSLHSEGGDYEGSWIVVED